MARVRPDKGPSGYRDCACRDCFDILVGHAGDLCHECEAAGCEPFLGYVRRGTNYECQRHDAYGVEENPVSRRKNPCPVPYAQNPLLFAPGAISFAPLMGLGNPPESHPEHAKRVGVRGCTAHDIVRLYALRRGPHGPNSTCLRCGWRMLHAPESSCHWCGGSGCRLCRQNPPGGEDEYSPDGGDISTGDRRTWWQYGKLYVTGDERALKRAMDRDKFWPNVFFISDHGNAHQITTITASLDPPKRKRSRKWPPCPRCGVKISPTDTHGHTCADRDPWGLGRTGSQYRCPSCRDTGKLFGKACPRCAGGKRGNPKKKSRSVVTTTTTSKRVVTKKNPVHGLAGFRGKSPQAHCGATHGRVAEDPSLVTCARCCGR